MELLIRLHDLSLDEIVSDKDNIMIKKESIISKG
jgi:hypothetical protein